MTVKESENTSLTYVLRTTYFSEEDLAGNVRWTFQRESFDEVGEDGVETGPVSVEEVLAALLYPVGSELYPVAEQSGRVPLFQRRHRHLEDQPADVDSDPVWTRVRLGQPNDRATIDRRRPIPVGSKFFATSRLITGLCLPFSCL